MPVVIAHPGASTPDRWQGLSVQPAGAGDDPAIRFADLVFATPGERVPAPVPVLRFAGDAPVRLTRVVFGWDLSDAALRALRAAWTLGSLERVDIVMIDPPREGRDRSDPGGALALALAARGLRAEICVMGGEPAGRLIDVARQRSCDAIVLGGDGRGAVAGAVLDAGFPVFCGG